MSGRVLDAAEATVAALNVLDTDDPYGTLLSEWLTVVDGYLDDGGSLPPKPPGDTKSWRDPWLSGFTWFHKKLGRFAGPRKWLQR